ncbi:MAG: hypothetical protein J6Y30_03955 [Treponema sp.]|nr:hypothetical protein [Treponema sp.]
MKKSVYIVLIAALAGTGFLFSQTSEGGNSSSSGSYAGSSASSASSISGWAADEFRRGVQSYYRGAYSEAILEFERALDYLPGENIILDWLGKAYYKAGIEGAALQSWNSAFEAGYGDILLQNRIEIVSDRRITQQDYSFTEHYTEAGNFPKTNGNVLLYSQPVSSLPNADGTIWVVAYGTNELLHYDVNGVIIKRCRGPVNGFDRPMDIIRLNDGNLLVSEFAGDRLSLLDKDGNFIKYYGKKGRGEGELVGPQYLAQDSFGNIYVTDFGNNRVVVFDQEGNGLLHFGSKTADFDGLKSPTGIAVVNDLIYVADSVKGAIYEFDRSGNFVGNLVNEKSFARPETMRNIGSYLLLADKNRIVTVDSASGSVCENATTGKTGALTSAVPDRNGNLVVTDFKANDIYVMSKVSELVGGYFVQIERVVSEKYPQVTVEVRVENRKRQPVVGLNENNFFITENKRPVSEMRLVGSANNNEYADFTILIDRSIEMQAYEEQVDSAVRELTAAMNGQGKVQIISVGSVPVTEFTGSPDALNTFSVTALKNPYSPTAALDLGVRLAANDLINAEKKRGIVYITSGTVTPESFSKYSLSDLTTYMNNNSISFSTVLVAQNPAGEEVEFITQNTTGTSYYVYRPEGLAPVVKDVINLPSGLYQITYTSVSSSEYGKKYIPLEVETYLLNHSGKDESGYFAPLE